MTIEEVKTWLGRARSIDKEINNLIAERDKAFLGAVSVSNGTNGERVQTTRENVSERKYIAYADYERDINEQIDRLYDVKSEILGVINMVGDSTYRTLLVMRYIRFMKWEEIREELGYDDIRWVYRLHNKALIHCGAYIR